MSTPPRRRRRRRRSLLRLPIVRPLRQRDVDVVSPGVPPSVARRVPHQRAVHEVRIAVLAMVDARRRGGRPRRASPAARTVPAADRGRRLLRRPGR